MLDFVVLSLAVFRLSMLLIYDNGPFDVFQRLRIRVGILYYDNGDMDEKEYKGWAGLLSCVWCASIWLGLLLALSYWAFPTYTLFFSMPLALSSMAGMYERIVNG